MVKELTLEELEKFESFAKYKGVKYDEAREKAEHAKATGEEWDDTFLMCPISEDDPRYGKKAKPVPINDENGILIGVEYIYV